MIERKFDLLEDEKIVREIGPAVLTNQRLLANWREDEGEVAGRHAVEGFAL